MLNLKHSPGPESKRLKRLPLPAEKELVAKDKLWAKAPPGFLPAGAAALEFRRYGFGKGPFPNDPFTAEVAREEAYKNWLENKGFAGGKRITDLPDDPGEPVPGLERFQRLAGGPDIPDYRPERRESPPRHGNISRIAMVGLSNLKAKADSVKTPGQRILGSRPIVDSAFDAAAMPRADNAAFDQMLEAMRERPPFEGYDPTRRPLAGPGGINRHYHQHLAEKFYERLRRGDYPQLAREAGMTPEHAMADETELAGQWGRIAMNPYTGKEVEEAGPDGLPGFGERSFYADPRSRIDTATRLGVPEPRFEYYDGIPWDELDFRTRLGLKPRIREWSDEEGDKVIEGSRMWQKGRLRKALKSSVFDRISNADPVAKARKALGGLAPGGAVFPGRSWRGGGPTPEERASAPRRYVPPTQRGGILQEAAEADELQYYRRRREERERREREEEDRRRRERDAVIGGRAI